MSKFASNGSSRKSVREAEQCERSHEEMTSASFRKYSADSLSGTASDNFVSDNDSWESDTDCYDDSSQCDGGGSDQNPKREKKESIRLGSLDSGVDIVVNPEDNDYDEDEKTDGDFGEEFDRGKCPLQLKWCDCYQLDVTLTSYKHGLIHPQTGQRKIQSILRAEPQIFTIITTEKKKRYRKKSKNQMDNLNSIGNNGRPRKNVRFINLPDDCKIPERDGKTSKKSGKIPVPIPSDQINKARKTLGVLKLKITGDTTNSVPLLRSIHSSHYGAKVGSPKLKRPVHGHHHHGSNSNHKPKVLAGPTFFHKTVKLVNGNGGNRKSAGSMNQTRKIVTYGDLKLKKEQKPEQVTPSDGEENILKLQDLSNENSLNYCNPENLCIDDNDNEKNRDESVNENDEETENYSDENSIEGEEEEESKDISDDNGNLAQKENMGAQEEAPEDKEDEVDEDLQRLRRSRRRALGYHIRQIQVEEGKQSTESSHQQGKNLSKVKKTPIFSDFSNTKSSKNNNNNNNDGSGSSSGSRPIKIKNIMSISKQLKQQGNEKEVKQQRQNSPARIVNTRYRRDSSVDEFPQFDF